MLLNIYLHRMYFYCRIFYQTDQATSKDMAYEFSSDQFYQTAFDCDEGALHSVQTTFHLCGEFYKQGTFCAQQHVASNQPHIVCWLREVRACQWFHLKRRQLHHVMRKKPNLMQHWILQESSYCLLKSCRVLYTIS